MVYEAVPIDVEIQKLTAAESSALSKYKIHENINTFLGNERTPTLIAGAAVLLSAPTILKIIFDALKKQDDSFELKEGAINYLTFVKDFGEAVAEFSGTGTFFTPGGSPFEGEIKDFWDKYVTK